MDRPTGRKKWADAIFCVIPEPQKGQVYHRVAVNGFRTYRWFEQPEQANAYIESVRQGRIEPDFSQG